MVGAVRCWWPETATHPRCPATLWGRFQPADQRPVAGLHRAGVQAGPAGRQPTGTGVVADHLHLTQTLQGLAGLLGVQPHHDLRAGALPAGRVDVDHRVDAGGGHPGKAGADQGDQVAPRCQALGEPADLTQLKA